MTVLDKFSLFMLSLLLFCIGFSTHLSLSIPIAEVVNRLKLPLLLIFIVIILFTVIKRNLKHVIYPLILSLIFPVAFLLINIFFKESINIKVVIMYFLWSIFLFYLIPLWIDDTRRLKEVMKIFLLTSILTVFIAIFLSYYNGGYITTMPERESYGFQNPNYFSQYLQIAIFSCFIIFILKQNAEGIQVNIFYKLLIFIIFSLFLYFCFDAKSRNVIVGIFVFIFWYRSYNYNKASRYTLRGLVAIIAFAVLISVDYTELNNASSGRFELWSFYISHTLNSQEFGVLFGAYTYPDASDFVLTYNRLEVVSGEKFHADNLFIELFVEAGLIGVFLFFLPVLFLLFKRGHLSVYKKVWTTLIAALLFQGLFIPNFSSFFSPISLFYAFCILSPLYFKYSLQNKGC